MHCIAIIAGPESSSMFTSSTCAFPALRRRNLIHLGKTNKSAPVLSRLSRFRLERFIQEAKQDGLFTEKKKTWWSSLVSFVCKNVLLFIYSFILHNRNLLLMMLFQNKVHVGGEIRLGFGFLKWAEKFGEQLVSIRGPSGPWQHGSMLTCCCFFMCT